MINNQNHPNSTAPVQQNTVSDEQKLVWQTPLLKQLDIDLTASNPVNSGDGGGGSFDNLS